MKNVWLWCGSCSIAKHNAYFKHYLNTPIKLIWSFVLLIVEHFGLPITHVCWISTHEGHNRVHIKVWLSNELVTVKACIYAWYDIVDYVIYAVSNIYKAEKGENVKFSLTWVWNWIHTFQALSLTLHDFGCYRLVSIESLWWGSEHQADIRYHNFAVILC